MKIKITNYDAIVAAVEATKHMINKHEESRNTDHGGRSRRGFKARWADTFHGFMGEIAVARALGLEWTPGGRQVSTGDVDNKIEVRTTDHPAGHLLIYNRDADNSRFYLVRGDFPYMDVVGWMVARDAKQKKYWRDNSDPPCYWVGSSQLTPTEEAGHGR